jgi:hypothetical protein
MVSKRRLGMTTFRPITRLDAEFLRLRKTPLGRAEVHDLDIEAASVQGREHRLFDADAHGASGW